MVSLRRFELESIDLNFWLNFLKSDINPGNNFDLKLDISNTSIKKKSTLTIESKSINRLKINFVSLNSTKEINLLNKLV